MVAYLLRRAFDANQDAVESTRQCKVAELMRRAFGAKSNRLANRQRLDIGLFR